MTMMMMWSRSRCFLPRSLSGDAAAEDNGVLFERLVGLMVVCLGVIAIFHHFLNQDNSKDDIWNSYVVDPEKIKDAQDYAEKVLGEKCRLSFAHQKMAILFPHKYDLNLSPFLKRNSGLTGNVFKYNTPFGFNKYNLIFSELVGLLPKVSLPEEMERKPCKRCIVLGSGGILRGLGLGPYLNTFDVVIRLNSAPVHGFTQDVGNKTTIRMSYPEGAPKSLHDYDPHMLFVAVMYKSADFSWLKAMVKKEEVPFWDSLWFWKAVPKNLPIEPEQFRILNPEIIRETAIDLLQLPEPRWKLWWWDQNIPTLGVSAVVLATHLCDEVSLAGFGYNLDEPETPLHYYENVRMEVMKAQTMHNVEMESKFLADLVEKGVVTDLSGGIHCKLCKTKS